MIDEKFFRINKDFILNGSDGVKFIVKEDSVIRVPQSGYANVLKRATYGAENVTYFSDGFYTVGIKLENNQLCIM